MAGLQIIEAHYVGQESDFAAKASAECVSGDQELLAARAAEPCHTQTSQIQFLLPPIDGLCKDTVDASQSRLRESKPH
jgi:hypothetical protein